METQTLLTKDVARPSHSRPVPILVVGRNRSGTKWLSNLLLNHAAIAGVQSEEHCGIVETTMFSAMPGLAGDLSLPQNYIALVLLWSGTDFYAASGIPPDFLLTRTPRPTHCFAAFRALMEELSREAKADYWLQKTSPYQAEAVIEHYPDARIVLIRRGLVPNLESWLQLAGPRARTKSALLVKLVFGYVVDEKICAKIARERGALRVQYEELQRDPTGVLQGVCRFLGIDFHPDMVTARFRSNTSFKAGARQGLDRGSIIFVGVVHRLARLIPLPLLRRLRGLLEPDETSLPRWMYRGIGRRYGIE